MRLYNSIHGLEPNEISIHPSKLDDIVLEIGKFPTVISIWLNIPIAEKLADLCSQAALMLREHKEMPVDTKPQADKLEEKVP